MTRSDRTKYEMLLRVRDFGEAHRALFSESSMGGSAFAKVAEAAARIESHAMTKFVAAQAGRTAKQVARKEVIAAVVTIATTARGLVPPAQGSQDLLVRPSRWNDTAILAAAHLFTEQAKPVERELIALGLPSTFLSDLEAAAGRFEKTLDARRAGRRDVAAAREGLAAALADGHHATRTLDIVVPNVLRSQHEMLAGWRRDRRVLRNPRKPAPDGPARVEPSAQGDGTAGDGPGTAAPDTPAVEPPRLAS